MGSQFECSNCGQDGGHVYGWKCPFNFHGEADPFKTSCAYCETEIPPNAPRASDQWGNLYCDETCRSAIVRLVERELGGDDG